MKTFLHSIFDGIISTDRKLIIFTGQNVCAEFFSNVDSACDYAQRASQHFDVYFGLGLVAGSPSGRGKRSDMCAISALWADIDILSDAHKEKRLPETEEDVRRHILDQLPLKPSAVIHSGHGVHAYWLLESPLVFDTPDTRDNAEKLTRGWHKLVCDKALESGWHIDNLGSLTQVLRVPDTWNYKISEKPAQVTINLFDPMIRYSLETIQPLISDVELSKSDSDSIDVLLKADAQPPAEKFAQLLTESPKFRDTWQRNRPDMHDDSQSAYDMSLATIAALQGWGNQEIADLIIAARRKNNDQPEKALRPDYISRTINAARASAAENGVVESSDVDISAIVARPAAIIQEYTPFPTETLPEPIRSYILAGSESLNCDPAYIALPALATLASCIGNTARILLKSDWKEPTVLWTAVISESGTMKSPAFKMAVNIVKTIQYKALTQYEADMRAYARALEEYDIALAHSKRSKNAGDPPEKPQEPAAQRFWVSDITSEAIAPILIHNPKGVLCAVDELATWVRGFDRYVSGGKGADVGRWLSMHDADTIFIDRKTQQQRIISVPSAAVSLTGTIQPGVFFDCFKQKTLRDSGLLARILVAMPPAKPAFWSEAEIPEDIQLSYESILAGLSGWQPVVDDNHIVIPYFIGMSHKAKQRFIIFVDEHAKEAAELSGELSSVWSKFKGAVARLALVFECVKAIADDPYATPADIKVGLDSVESAITLVKWFKLEAARIYESFNEDDSGQRFDTIVDAIKKHGGAVSPRDLMRIGPCYKSKEEAKRKLDEMAKEGVGVWRYRKIGDKGGAPKMEFALT